MQDFGRKISEYERKYKFETELSDDIVQGYFEKDADYNSVFREEVKLSYDAAAEKDETKSADLIRESIEKYACATTRISSATKRISKKLTIFSSRWKASDNLRCFWLTSPQSGDISPEIALKGVQRGGKQWSQGEVLALFLLLNKLSKPKIWAESILGSKTESVIELISNSKDI